MNLMLSLLLAMPAWASDDHEGGNGARTGKDKAVLEASAEQGMKLSSKAVTRLGIKTAALTGGAPFRVPAAALVYSAEEVGLYLLKDGWYKHVDVELLSKDKASARIRPTAALKTGDQVVVAGAALLRVAELDVLGGEEGGHDH